MTENGKLDMALDDIIKQSKPTRGGGGRGGGSFRGGRRAANSGGGRAPAFRGRGNGGGRRINRVVNQSIPRSRNVPDGQWTHDRFNDELGTNNNRSYGFRSGAASSAAMNGTTKLLISNLDFGVSDSDIKELFGEFGAIRRAAVHYDKSSRSLGSADVVFERRSDAIRAVKQYNGVPLDGRAMKIQIVTANMQTTTQTAIGSGFGSRLRGFSDERRQNVSPRRGGGRRGGPARGGRGGNRGREERKPVTQEQLDADLEAYINKS